MVILGASQPAGSAFDWANFVVMAAIALATLIGSHFIARRAARAQIASARQQALETAMVKLRHSITERRLDRFYTAVTAVQDLYLGASDALGFAKRMASLSLVHQACEAASCAALVSPPADQEQVKAICDSFWDAANEVHAAACKYRARSSDDTALHEMADAAARLYSCIYALNATVDWAAGRRIEAAQDRPALDALDVYGPKWERLLQKTMSGPEGSPWDPTAT